MSSYRIERTNTDMWNVLDADGKIVASCFNQGHAEREIAKLTSAPPLQAGWSNAARRRAGHATPTTDTPLGRGFRSGKGYTMYEDFNGDGMNSQIWDES